MQTAGYRFDQPVPWMPGARHTPGEAGCDAVMRQLEQAFRPSGGVAGCDEVARLLRSHSQQPVSQLARWIVARQVVSFVVRSQTFVPLFQFDLEQITLRPGVSQVIAELSDTFDDWELATWFARPNSALDDVAPVDVIGVDLPAVLDAARIDRFVACGD